MDGSSGRHHRHHPTSALGICLPVRLRFSPKMTWLAGNNYTRVVDVFDVRDLSRGTPPVPLVQLPAGCDAVAFSRDDGLMATSGAALYRTAPKADGWLKLWSAAVPAPPRDDPIADGLANDVSFSPDEPQLLVSRCDQITSGCVVSLLSVETGAIVRGLPELQSPHPSFSPEGSWIVAGGTLLHLPSGDVRKLDPDLATTTALFTPDGDIIAGSADDVLTRYPLPQPLTLIHSFATDRWLPLPDWLYSSRDGAKIVTAHAASTAAASANPSIGLPDVMRLATGARVLIPAPGFRF